MAIPSTPTVFSRSPEALLSFTANTATTLLPCSRRIHRFSLGQLPPLHEFIATVFQRAQLPPCVSLVSLIYLQRLKNSLPRHACGDLDTPYRLFLAAVLSASKFVSENGTCLTSQSVAEMTDYLYTSRDINLIERSFLGLLKYDLYVDVQGIKDFLAANGKLLEMDLVETEDLDHRS